VIRVTDGDTVTVRVGQRDLRVRLLGGLSRHSVA
jgi:hypothetical protein